MDRNIKTYYVRQFFHNLIFFLPILVVFYEDLGFNLTQIFIFQSVASFTAILGKILAGLLADRFGRKKVLLLGIFICCIWMFFYLFAATFWEFIWLDVVWGIGYSFIMVEIPLISDTLLSIGDEQRATEVFSIPGRRCGCTSLNGDSPRRLSSTPRHTWTIPPRTNKTAEADSPGPT